MKILNSTNNGDRKYWGGAMVVVGDIIETLSGLLNKQRKGKRRH